MRARAVGQSRERVVEGFATCLFFDRTLRGRVAHRARDANRVTGCVAHDDAGPLHREPLPTLVPHAMFTGEAHTDTSSLRGDIYLNLCAVCGMYATHPLLSGREHFVSDVAKHLAPTRREANAIVDEVPVPQRFLCTACGQKQPFGTVARCARRRLDDIDERRGHDLGRLLEAEM